MTRWTLVNSNLKGLIELMPDADITQDYSFWWKENIRWGDQDAMGHVNNVQFARYIEASRIPFFLKLIGGDKNQGPSFILARLEVNYLREMYFPGQVEVGTNVSDIGTSSVSLAHAIFNKKICTGTGKSIVVHIDTESRKPTPIPDYLQKLLAKQSH